MIRQTLLAENLISRQLTRVGPVFMFRKPQGPPVADDASVDRWLHKTTQAFDFSPLFMGDQFQARVVAQRYTEHLKKQARRDDLEWSSVSKRLKEISPHLLRGFRTFFAYYDGAVRTG